MAIGLYGGLGTGIDFDQYRMMPYFVTDSAAIFVSTAKFIWITL